MHKYIKYVLVATAMLCLAALAGTIALAEPSYQEWYDQCPPDPPTRTPWFIRPTYTPLPAYEIQPTYTPAPVPTCRPTATLAPNPSPTLYPTQPPLDTPTPYPSPTPYPTQPPVWPTGEPTQTPTATATQAPEPTNTPMAGADYYVAVNGDDDSPGTEAQPFRTIQKGVDTAQSGEIVYVRQGTYHERVVINSSITLQSCPGETATIDGQRDLPGQWNYLLRLNGENINVTNMEVTGANDAGVGLMGNYNKVQNLDVHHNRGTGIYVAGDHNLVTDCTVWWNSDGNEYGAASLWGGGIALGHGTSYNTARGNVVYNNWGEGILSMRRTEYATIEQNVVYDNWSVNVYANGSYVEVQRNLIYTTGDTRFYRHGTRPATGIAICDETEYISRHKTIVNNLVLGCNRAFFFFIQQQGAGLKNALIANNTFANSDLDTLFQIVSGDHEDVRIENNIFVQDDGLPIAIVIDDPDLSFSHNLWSKTPPSTASGDGDVIADPLLTQGDWGAGTLVSDWFKLLPGSPAIDAGLTLSEVLHDFDNVTRPQGTGYDMGAFEE